MFYDQTNVYIFCYQSLLKYIQGVPLSTQREITAIPIETIETSILIFNLREGVCIKHLTDCTSGYANVYDSIFRHRHVGYKILVSMIYISESAEISHYVLTQKSCIDTHYKCISTEQKSWKNRAVESLKDFRLRVLRTLGVKKNILRQK